MLRRLVKHGIKCSYILINATSYVMKEVSPLSFRLHQQCGADLYCFNAVYHLCQRRLCLVMLVFYFYLCLSVCQQGYSQM